MMAQQYFITGIGTGIGKTIASAAITEKLKADYWKPIQSGDLSQSDQDSRNRRKLAFRSDPRLGKCITGPYPFSLLAVFGPS